MKENKEEKLLAFKDYWSKIKEALISVVPISLVVIILSFTPLFNLSGEELALFILSTLFLIFGIALFNQGADQAMSSMGEQVGSALTRTKKLIIIASVMLIMGVLITIAEPDLSVLSRQLSGVVKSFTLTFAIGLGVGIFLVVGVLKIIFKIELTPIIMFSYLLVFALVALMIYKGSGNFLAISFDSGGVTTGPITVPFLMALGVGMSATIGGRNAKENSFGLVTLCSIGPILAVLIIGCINKTTSLDSSQLFDLSDYDLVASDFMHEFLEVFISQIGNVALSLTLIVVFFLIINFIFIHLPIRKLIRIGFGVLSAFIGLVLFLTAAEIGYLPVGFKVGKLIANYPVWGVIIAFIFGFLTVLAEPAVHVLTSKVEEVTSGAIHRKSMLMALCIGVGLSIMLSIIRIIFDFPVLYYLIPGYIFSVGLSILVPKIYTAIAFDSGGVASGPLTSSFMLPFAIGFCSIVQPDRLLEDAFGIVAMVAMTPLITIQLLGIISVIRRQNKFKGRYKIISSIEDDEVIISF